MEVYERIKARRKEIGLTADAVADALGVSRATVYRYESADIEKLPITIIEPLSKVLHTTPEYLMGWEDAPADGPALTDREAELLRRYRSLDDVGRDRVDMNLNFEYDRCAAEKGEDFRRSEDAC